MMREIFSVVKWLIVGFTVVYTLNFLKPHIPEAQPPVKNVNEQIDACHKNKRKVILLSSRSDEYITEVICKPLKLDVLRNFFKRK